jgi:hypothetical protein
MMVALFVLGASKEGERDWRSRPLCKAAPFARGAAMSVRESIVQLLLIALPWAILVLIHKRAER